MNEDMKLEKGSGNIYRDFNRPDADIRQTKALLAAEIIGVLDRRTITAQQAAEATGIDHAEFVRIQKPDLQQFTIDRLITILNKLDQQVEVTITVSSRMNDDVAVPA